MAPIAGAEETAGTGATFVPATGAIPFSQITGFRWLLPANGSDLARAAEPARNGRRPRVTPRIDASATTDVSAQTVVSAPAPAPTPAPMPAPSKPASDDASAATVVTDTVVTTRADASAAPTTRSEPTESPASTPSAPAAASKANGSKRVALSSFAAAIAARAKAREAREATRTEAKTSDETVVSTSTPTPASAPAPAPAPEAGTVTLNDFTFDFGDTQVSTPVDPTAATLPAFDAPGSMRISDASPGGLSAALDPAPVAETGTNGGGSNGAATAEDDDAPRFDEDGNPLFDVPAPKTPSAGPKTSSVFGENVAAASGPIQLPPDLTRPDAGIAARGANDASEIAAVDDAIADALGQVDGDDADVEEVTPVPDAPLAPMPVAPPAASAASAATANAVAEPADASTAATIVGTPDAASRAAATAGTATVVTPATAPSAPRPAPAGSTPVGESLPPAEQLRVTIAALGNDVRERDDIARVVLQYALSRYKRAALFVIKKEMLVGWEGGGSSLARSAVRGIMVPLTNPSIFKTVYETKVLYCGGVPHTTVNDIFFNALGDPRPERVIVVPFVLRDKVACVLYADGGDVDVETPDSIGELYQLGRAVSTAFEHLILRNKRS